MSARNAPHSVDRKFLLICVALLCSGLFILASASMPLAQQEYGNALYYVVRQITIGGAAGLLALLLVQIIPLSLIRGAALPSLIITIAFLIGVFLPGIGLESGGATRWIHAGPVAIQPAEIAKITLPLYLAAWFSSRGLETRWQHSRSEKKRAAPPNQEQRLFPFLVIIGALGIPIILQPDLSTFGILAATGLLVYFLAGAPFRVLSWLLASGAVSFVLLVRLAPYRMNRILSFLNPQADPLGAGYQINQALLAIGSGGVFGRGLGFSREKLFFLPEPIGDSIFAIFAEETGFLGSALLISLFVLFLWRGFAIARRLPDAFMQLFTAGLVAGVAIQAFLNIAGNLALFPIVGITLPFVSYGSASLAVTMLSAGLVLKMSRYTRVP
ncbi:MAG: hypothetical protein A2991_00570 [Candidatus Terrybacteria bacterium RIFCSPLOWO2_01_FULL_58_14]|uniref:Probable peptidoglycan glycosyltransferase FtsW n=2 Tax=Candidatus Terryibacteriota TaxID=1817920 RepID=A0A1G2PWA5_9BACT|nr:MAG: hypothetical protein A2682_01145 [Candidatus Terrybacteria bacterium RIFCSPHIGHO2_01_FULL_58_15]OHA52610.1 MAG: hypothetical protein A2991_00570 [Candidatus Terrybacteria bacterium RIFCSPLOWO2_01_FULL_58_14]